MLETFTAITTSITAIFSIWIAYKSHITTINQKKIENEERSEKVIRLFKRETRYLSSRIYILTMGSIENQKKLKSDTPLNIYGTIESNDIINIIKEYRTKTREIISDRLNELSLKDEERLSKAIKLSGDLLVTIEMLGWAVKKENNQEEIQKYQEKIAEITEELVNDI